MTLHQLVAKAYPAPEWATFFEVANATGSAARRHADAVAMGIWPSRGLLLVGFEIKDYRSDWLREQKNPAKAEAIVSKVDRFYLVTIPGVVTDLAEIPDTWGLLEADAARRRLLVKKTAPDMGRAKGPIDRGFMAAMLRKVPETTVPKVDVERQIEERLAAERDRWTGAHNTKALEGQVANLQRILDSFRERTGIDLRYGWPPAEEVGHAVRALMELKTTGQRMADELNGLVHRADAMGQILGKLADMARQLPNLGGHEDGRTQGTDTTTGPGDEAEPATGPAGEDRDD